jgi:hypothetical protein
MKCAALFARVLMLQDGGGGDSDMALKWKRICVKERLILGNFTG